MKILDLLEQLEKQATPGPWSYWTSWGRATVEQHADRLNPIAYAVDYIEREDAQFICEMRNALPALLKVVRAAKRCSDSGELLMELDFALIDLENLGDGE